MTWAKYYFILVAVSVVICWIAAWRDIRRERMLRGFLLALVAPFVLSGLLYVGTLIFILARDGI